MSEKFGSEHNRELAVEIKNEAEKPIVEVADFEIGLTKREKDTIDSLDQSEIKFIKELKSENLNKEKTKITAVRSEDIIFLLEGIRKGYLPVGELTLRTKAENHFYVTPNPESAFLAKKQPEILEVCIHKKFKEVVQRNLSVYADVAIAAAIHRNIFSDLRDTKGLPEALMTYYHTKYPQESVSDDIARETYFNDLVEEVLRTDLSSNIFRNPRRNPALGVLGYFLKINNVNPEKIVQFLKTLPKRGGIALAFNEKLFEEYSAVTEGLEVIHDANEVAFKIPSGRVSLDTLLGFESLGEFEDGVLDKIK